VYSGQRVAGDFYEFLRVGPSRMLFVLLDIAGLRADTREILIAVQKTFRILAPELLSGEDFNETTTMIELCNEMNLTICVAVFAVVRHSSVAIPKIWGRSAMPMRDIRRGCFAITRGSRRSRPPGCLLACSRTRCRARLAVTLCPALLVVSRGIVEADYIHAGNLDADHQAPEYAAEFGLDGVKQSFQHATALKASELCLTILQAARKFTPSTPTHNDLTTLVLVRTALDDCFAV
jgi:hypothetical protein